MEETEELVDLRACKAEAMRRLPCGNATREMLSKEPDFLPRREGLAKIELYIRLLVATRRL